MKDRPLEIKSQPSITLSSGKYGAPMGRNEFYENPTGRVTTFRVKIDSGGYDRGGNYWGLGDPLYCQCEVNSDGYTSASMSYRLFTRAKSKALALKQFEEVRKAKKIYLPVSLRAWIVANKYLIDQVMIREYSNLLNLDPSTRLNAINRAWFVRNHAGAANLRAAAIRQNVQGIE